MTKTSSKRRALSKKFKGIRTKKGDKWVSEVQATIWLGSYDTLGKAARAYDHAVYCLTEAKAKFNFPPAGIQAAAAKYAVEGLRQASENESQTCIDGQLILEEENPALLDSFLQEFESSRSSNTNVDDSSAQHEPLDGSDFLVLDEQEGLGVSNCPKL